MGREGRMERGGRDGEKEGERQGGGERVAEVDQCTSWLVLQRLGLKGSICPSILGQARTTQQHCPEGTSGPWPPDHRTLGLGKLASPKRGWLS